MCFFCPTAVCVKCYYDVDFALVKRNRGFCRHCSKLAFLIEKNADVDSDGVSFFSQSCLVLCTAKERNKKLQQYVESKFKDLDICLFYVHLQFYILCTNCQCLWEEFSIKTIQDCCARAVN